MLVPRHYRVLVSYAVAAAAACSVALRDHVHIAVRNPATWSNVLDHRCGIVMLLCTCWALLEMAAVMILPRQRDVVLRTAQAR